MAMDLTGVNNYNEYYTNHYFSSVFEKNAEATISAWRTASREDGETRTPWSLLRECGRLYYANHERAQRARSDVQVWPMIKEMADRLLAALGFPAPAPFIASVGEETEVPVYLEMKKANGAPLLWVLLTHSKDGGGNPLQGYFFDGAFFADDAPNTSKLPGITELENEELITKILFNMSEAPRWLILAGINGVALIDRNKWNEKRYLYFDLDEIFSRREESTLQAMAVLLHRESLCPDDGASLLDKLDENSHRHASGVSQDLKYALRESIELLGNEVLYDMARRQGRNLETNSVDAEALSLECLLYMYRMLFVLFIEARSELGYAPMKDRAYALGYSLESLRDIADGALEDTSEVGGGYYLHETLSKLFGLIYDGYPRSEEALKEAAGMESLHDVFVIEPLKAHIFDPEFTRMITASKLRNSVMLKIIDLMSISRGTGRKGSRGRISYSALGINQMGAVYEALLSYRGFIAEETLFEVKRAQDKFDELEVGYFVPERELDNYSEDERARYEDGENAGKLRKYEKGAFIYRLAGREREKSASYYTPEVLTKCLVKYALKELLQGKTADEILSLTICEPAMGSAAFLNEAVNQLAEAYIDRKQRETDNFISFEERNQEIQRVKMYIADRNVYGIDLNPVAVELAEVSLWLNTIFKGGFVPWFGTQLVNGNSLIGARRQVYRVGQLSANHAPDRWWENEPVRLEPKAARMPKKQVYHFLMGDPGMSSYTDKVIKELAPDEIKAIKDWNKNFIKPFTEDDLTTLLRLSAVIDSLWKQQVSLRREIDDRTNDRLSVYGREDKSRGSKTTIREKDRIYKEIYLSERMKNAGPYARLKFAMDYWCALWFWPIDKAGLLPTRSEFLFDMFLILEGTMDSVAVSKGTIDERGNIQLSLFPTESEQLLLDFSDKYKGLGVVDLPALCERQPRLALVKEIASRQRFLHWELEFADVFEERGGFDLIVGNPPWIKMEWNEKSVLSDTNPIFAVKNLTATQTTRERSKALDDAATKRLYFAEYETMIGTQNFLNAAQNYAILKGQQTNLFKCFLPQSWMFSNKSGCAAFIHPEGVYDDPQGGALRQKLYERLRTRFLFANERKLFGEVDHHTTFILNVYGGPLENREAAFECIDNLYDVSTIDQCYDSSIQGPVPGIKDENNKWNVKGHPDRLIHIRKKELALFASLFDGNDNWEKARLPILHAKQLIEVLEIFAEQKQTLADMRDEICTTEMWHETNRQNDGTIMRNSHFPETALDMIYSGSHIGVANPLFKCSRMQQRNNHDFDNVDLQIVPEDYFQRCNFSPSCEITEYIKRVPATNWTRKCFDVPRIVMRNMFNQGGERTLISAIAPEKTGHVHAVFEISFVDDKMMLLMQSSMSSIVYDFYIKAQGKDSGGIGVVGSFPVLLINDKQPLIIRTLLLNALNIYYRELWKTSWDEKYKNASWSKLDPRLKPERFTSLTSEWTWNTPLRTDYERRQALVEIDVLTAMALGMTLDQLKTIYRIQFPVLQSYEADTWYDRNGRIIFTNNRSMTGVGFSRPEWGNIKDAASGTFIRTITDDTMPGGPVERTIEYVAPFDRCDREKDYETAWAFFERKYKKQA